MSILAFGSEQNFHTAVARAAKNHELPGEHAETVAVAGDWFDSTRPELLVLCFDSVEKSDIGLKALYAHSKLAAFTDVKTLLLCSNNEIAAVLQPCLDRIFNDYLIAKPLQDGAQLEWRLHSLMLGYRSTPKAAINQIASQLEKMKKKHWNRAVARYLIRHRCLIQELNVFQKAPVLKKRQFFFPDFNMDE